MSKQFTVVVLVAALLGGGAWLAFRSQGHTPSQQGLGAPGSGASGAESGAARGTVALEGPEGGQPGREANRPPEPAPRGQPDQSAAAQSGAVPAPEGKESGGQSADAVPSELRAVDPYGFGEKYRDIDAAGRAAMLQSLDEVLALESGNAGTKEGAERIQMLKREYEWLLANPGS